MSGRRKITVRVDGSHELGMGHVMRCIRLVKYLKSRLQPLPEITIATADNNPAVEILQAHGSTTVLSNVLKAPHLEPDEYDEKIFTPAIPAFPQNVLILDCNWEKHPEFIEPASGNTPVVSLHEHNFPVLEGVAAAINPSLVEQEPPPGGVLGETHFQGPEYLLIDADIPDLAIKRRKQIKSPAEVFICLGGADPDGYTYRAAKAIADMDGIRLQIITGPAFDDDEIKRLSDIPGVIIREKPLKTPPLIVSADIAIVNGATTMFESIALGVPAIAIPRNPYEKLQADICSKAGAVLVVSADEIEEKLPVFVEKLINDSELRKNLSMKGLRMIDGKGLARVADIILDCLS